MNYKSKGLIKVGLPILILILSLSINSIQFVHSEKSGSSIALKITYAAYGDLDFDGYEDDIIIISKLTTFYQEPILTFLYLDITSPSNLVYRFTFQTIINTSGGSQVFVIIKTYDTAIESGWYSAKLSSIFIYQELMFFDISNYTFDPPTENGPGEPTAELFITYT